MKTSSRLAFRAMLLYCVIACLWITFSDELLVYFVRDPQWLTHFQTYKGMAFVAVTAIFFFVTLRNQLRQWEKETAERIRAEVALSANQEKMRAIFDAEPECIKLLEPDGTLHEINPAGVKLVEAESAASMIGQCIFPAVIDEDREAVKELLAAAGRGEKRSLEFKIINFKGKLLWLDMHVVPINDPTTGRNLVLAVSREISERKRMEAELALRERRLNAFFTNAPAGLVLLDEHLRYVQINSTVAEINGLPISDHLGKTIREILPKFAPVVEPLLRQVISSGEPMLNIELAGETPSQPGVLRHWMESFFPIAGQNGRTDSVGVILVEITERKLAEERARQDEVRLRKIIDSMFAFVGLFSLDGRVLEINRSLLDTTGLRREEVLGKFFVEADWWADSAPAQAQLRDALHRAAQGETVRTDFKLRVGKNNLVIDATFGPLRDTDGRVVQIVGSGADVTARIQAEKELRWKTAFLEAQVDSALDGILVVDSRGKKLLQNQRMVDLWKFPPSVVENENSVGQLQFSASQTKNPEEFTRKVNHLYAHPDVISHDEIELINGTVLDRYSSPVRDKAGKYYGRIWTIRNITEQRKLEAQLRQAQKMKAIGQLASGVAHDFNNILAVIRLQADSLENEESLTPEQRDYAREIGNAAQRAANLTRQLLLFSRQQTIRSTNVDLNDIVTHITKMLQRVLGENIRMQFKYAPQPLAISVDAGMIDQVLMNLAVNARDAMTTGGQLSIETSAVEFDVVTAPRTPQARPGLFACLSFTDTGGGIPPEILPRIFEPFFTTKDIGKGTGLGLATVFGIIQQHEGWINVESQVGNGTTFRIYLPQSVKTLEQNSEPRPPATLPGGHEMILLVEDDADVRSIVSHTLSRLGYRLVEATTGVEAKEIWPQYRDECRLLLTDLMMPGGISGRELAQQLLQDRPQLKTLYISGYSGDVVGKDFVLREGENFLLKPFEAHKLAQTVRDCLDKV